MVFLGIGRSNSGSLSPLVSWTPVDWSELFELRVPKLFIHASVTVFFCCIRLIDRYDCRILQVSKIIQYSIFSMYVSHRCMHLKGCWWFFNDFQMFVALHIPMVFQTNEPRSPRKDCDVPLVLWFWVAMARFPGRWRKPWGSQDSSSTDTPRNYSQLLIYFVVHTLCIMC